MVTFKRRRPAPVHAMRDRPASGEGVVPDLEIIEARFVDLQEELTAALGDESLCAVSRTAGAVPAAKHAEGRLAALMELRRSLRGGGGVEASLAEQLDAWRRWLDDVTVREAGPDWQAYRAGGVDELEHLAARLVGSEA